MPARLPLALDLRDQPVTVIGGGAVAERKVLNLLECAARVRVIAPETTPELARRAAAGELTWIPRTYAPGDLADCLLAFAASNNLEVNQAVAAEATERGLWCNVASPPEAGSCQVMASFQRGGITVALGTAGASPYAARKLRERLEEAVPPALGSLVELLGELRGEVIARHEDEAARRAVWERLWHSAALAHLQAGNEAAARAALRQALDDCPSALPGNRLAAKDV